MAMINSFQQYDGKHLKELFFQPLVQKNRNELEDVGVKLMIDVQSRLKIYKSTSLDKITRKRTSCGNGSNVGTIDVTTINLDVVNMQSYNEVCADKFMQTVYETSLKKGNDINDITDTDINEALLEHIIEATGRDLIRQLWLGDTSLTNNDYNAYDGWLKRIAAGVSGSTIVNHNITAMATATDAYNALLNVYRNQPMAMKSVLDGEKVFIVTRNIYDRYMEYVTGVSGPTPVYQNLVNGVPQLTFYGIPVVPGNILHQYLNADFNTIFNNGRVILCVKEQSLVAGIEETESEVQHWYSLDDDLMKYRVRYKAGTQLLHHDYFSVGGF